MSLRLRPDHQAARDNMAIALLLAENFREGWPAWTRSFTKLQFPPSSVGGATFDSKRVAIYGTGGVGDEIMYTSRLAALSRHAAEITLHCDRRLTSLFRRSFPSVTVLGMDKENAKNTIGMVAPDEIHLPSSFLPAYFPPSVESAARRGSFLAADPAQVSEWRKRFDALGSGLKIGLSWRGGVEPVNRPNVPSHSRRGVPFSRCRAFIS